MSNVEKEPGPQGEDSPIAESPSPDEKKKREYKDFGHDEEKPTRRHSPPSDASPSHALLPAEANIDMALVSNYHFFFQQISSVTRSN